MPKLIEFTDDGLYCPQADIYIDPWRPVDRAIITHVHKDHAKMGHRHYLTHHDGIPLLRHTLGRFIDCQGMDYRERITMNGVNISLHPAGHILGSSQVRIEYKGEVWVVSGDYKLLPDGISTPYECVKCDVFISEATFGLPIFKWRPQHKVFEEMNNWWAKNNEDGKCSILAGYALGKAQRIMHMLDRKLGKIYAHTSIDNINSVLRQQGIDLPKIERLHADLKPEDLKNALVLVPPSALHSLWLNKFQPYSVAVASGWMGLKRSRQRVDIDEGFVLSDHADWDQLKEAVLACGAKEVYITHGNSSAFSRWLDKRGIANQQVKTVFEGEMAEMAEIYAEN